MTPFQTIVDMVMVEYDIRFTRLVGRTQEAEIARARQAIYWAVMRATALSNEDIAAYFNRERTTVIHGIYRAQKYREDNPAFKAFTDRLVAAVPDKAVPE